jgi:hypothetical protein
MILIFCSGKLQCLYNNIWMLTLVFSGNSIATKAVDAYMKLVGWQYLDDTIGGALRYICANRVCCEVSSVVCIRVM